MFVKFRTKRYSGAILAKFREVTVYGPYTVIRPIKFRWWKFYKGAKPGPNFCLTVLGYFTLAVCRITKRI